MSIYISIVSHGHEKIIKELCCVSELSEKFNIVLKSNKPNENFCDLMNSHTIHWIDEQYGCGFGHNNNIVFNYCRFRLGMKDDDIFIVLNPDVIITINAIEKLAKEMIEGNISLAAINLYKDSLFNQYDNSIREFPSLFHFVKSFLGLPNSSLINKSIIHEACRVDWAAGSFIAFKAKHYHNLQGFDEKYFMYCEDIDICYRSCKLNEKVMYFPSIKATHLACHANRRLLSKHFYWHVRSVVRFLLTKVNLTINRSSIIK